MSTHESYRVETIDRRNGEHDTQFFAAIKDARRAFEEEAKWEDTGTVKLFGILESGEAELLDETPGDFA